MKLTVLGSGTAVPHPQRSAPGFWLETTSGLILLDCGASAVDRIARENLDWAQLDAIWISHFHLDHVGGLPAFLFGTRHAAQMQNRVKPLKIFGARGLRELIDAFDAAGDYKLLKQRFPIEILEVEPLEKFEILPRVEAVALDTPHTAESLALHLRDTDDKTFVYTSDTGYAKIVATLARAVDLLVMECSFVKDKPLDTHLELAEAMHLIRYGKPKKALLTHFYAEWDAVDFDAEVKKFEPSCAVIQAQDGLRLEV